MRFLLLVSVLFFVKCTFAQNSPTTKITDKKITLKHKGLTRYYYIHQPSGFKSNAARPIIFVLHSGGEDASTMITFSHFNELADRDTVWVVYPAAYENHWNDGRFEKGNPNHKGKNINDVSFIDSIIEREIQIHNVDSSRIFVTGIANGAIMTYKLACRLSHKITAIAPVLGSMAEYTSLTCKPMRSISVLAINGSDDKLIPINGGEVAYDEKLYGRVNSLKETISFWAHYNDSTKDAGEVTRLPDMHKSDGTAVFYHKYYNEKYETEIIQYLIEGGGHAWPGAKQFYPMSVTGNISKEINATELIWNFFLEH